MAQAKKTTKTSTAKAKTKRGPGRPSKKKEPERPEFLGSEMVIIGSFALAVLLFLSNFHLCGVVGDFLRSVQLGLFGMIGFIAPLVMFVGACFYLSNVGNPIASLKLGASIAAVLVLCGLGEALFGEPFQAGVKLTEFYKASAATGLGGGLVGGTISHGLYSLVGKVGTYLLLFVLLAVSLVVITEKSLVSLVKRSGVKAAQYAKEDMDRRKEAWAEHQEEKRRLREERVVRGVDLDATKLEDSQWDDGEELSGLVESLEQETDRGRKRGRKISKEEWERASAEPVAAAAADGREAWNGDGDAWSGETAASGQPAAGGRDSRDDVFTGTIAYPHPVPEDEPSFGEDDLAAVERAVGATDGEDGGDTIYLRKDTRTLEEMNLVEEDFHRSPEPAEEDSIPWEPLAPEGEAKREDSVFEPGFSPVFREDEPSFDDDEPEFGRERFDGGGEYGRDGAPAPWNMAGTAFGPGTAAEGETGQSGGTGEAFFQDGETQHGRGAEGDPFAAAMTDGAFTSPEGERRVVTASGKVIETDTELLKKRVEKKRAEAVEAGDSPLSVSEEIAKKEETVKKEYVFPPLNLLKRGARNSAFSENEYKETAVKLQQTLRNFGVGVTVTNISCGPSVTRYELHPEQGVKVSKIVGLTDDIKLSLAAADIRIEAPIPGKSAVGIEVPNKENNVVYLREILEADGFQNHKSNLAFAVGKDIGGQVVVTDIAKMPHLLIAGATGSGKSVCINTLIMSIIYKSKPEDVKLIMVDPKVVELSVYNGIPHLLIPVVTDPKKASGALNWAVAEMMDRYEKFAKYNVRDLKGYNDKVARTEDIQDENKPKKLPQIVIIIDELADLMMVAPGEVEDAICRLAQLARAAGIHLVIATQRPSVNVITGLIKANVPSRIAFAVSSGVDSRTIIDMNGAEKLLGKGDMLFYPSGFPKPQRVQGAFVSDEEVQKVVDFLTEQGMSADYSPEVVSRITAAPSAQAAGGDSGRDEYFVQAGRFILEKEKASIGMLQRMFKIGFNRAARIMDQLADAGVVGEEEGTKPRKVLMTMDEFEEKFGNGQ